MDRMRTLAQKSLWNFLLTTTLILLLCAPLMYLLMVKYYTNDLDELIEVRSNEFIAQRLPSFKLADIDRWNEYNEDLTILPYSHTYPISKPVQQPFINKAEKHAVDYRILYKEVKIEKHSFILASRIPMIESHDLTFILFAQYGLLFFLLLIVLMLIQRIMSKRLWRSFYETLQKAGDFNLERGEVPQFSSTKTTEFARLNQILTALLSKDVQVYQRQKRFFENASHEMQTPLAVFQSQLDMLMQQPQLTQQQATTIESLYAVTARMTRLNKNLLLLAKIDNAQFGVIQDIDFVNALYTQLSYLRDLAENNGINVSVEVANGLKVTANCDLLESLINNLVVNAIRHNTAGGVIRILVTGHCFIINNTAQEAGALDEDRIFQRFSRTSERKKGNGLGLSIVSEIAKRYDWHITYSYVNAMHQFTTKFR